MTRNSEEHSFGFITLKLQLIPTYRLQMPLKALIASKALITLPFRAGIKNEINI